MTGAFNLSQGAAAKRHHYNHTITSQLSLTLPFPQHILHQYYYADGVLKEIQYSKYKRSKMRYPKPGSIVMGWRRVGIIVCSFF